MSTDAEATGLKITMADVMMRVFIPYALEESEKIVPQSPTPTRPTCCVAGQNSTIHRGHPRLDWGHNRPDYGGPGAGSGSQMVSLVGAPC